VNGWRKPVRILQQRLKIGVRLTAFHLAQSTAKSVQNQERLAEGRVEELVATSRDGSARRCSGSSPQCQRVVRQHADPPSGTKDMQAPTVVFGVTDGQTPPVSTQERLFLGITSLRIANSITFRSSVWTV
jgi:hypothetical protein